MGVWGLHNVRVKIFVYSKKSLGVGGRPVIGVPCGNRVRWSKSSG